MEELKIFTKTPLSSTDVPVEVRTAHLPNTVRLAVLAVYTGVLTNTLIL
jgi:hypothetical protein